MQHPHHRSAVRHVVGLAQQIRHFVRRQVPAAMENVFGVQHPPDGIQIPLRPHHREAGMGGFLHRPAHHLGGDRGMEGHDVHPRGHHFPHRLVGRFEQALDYPPLPGGDVAALLPQRRQGPDVVGGDGLLGPPLDAQQAQQPFSQAREQPGQGPDPDHQSPNGGGGDQPVPHRAAGGQRFRGHLPEDQHQHGDYQGGHYGPPRFPHQGNGDGGGQRSGEDIDEVVGHQDGADGTFQVVDQ